LWVVVGAVGGVSCGVFFFSSRRRHTRLVSDWSSDVCSSDLVSMPPRPLQVATMLDNLGGMLTGAGALTEAMAVLERALVLRETRSEERRVGKEGRSGGGGERWERKKEEAAGRDGELVGRE